MVVLKLDQKSIPKLVDRVTAIVSAMTANKSTFPTPSPTLAQIQTDLTALSAAQAALKGHTGSRVDRDAAVKVIVADMSQTHAYVQSLANANPAQAATIAGDAAMTLRTSTRPPKAPLASKQKVSGSVIVVAKAVKGAKSNEWQYSTDGKTWIDLPPTSKATTTVPNLTVATTVSFRHRVLTKTGQSDWGQPISALVN